MDAHKCNLLIQEHKDNPNKKISNPDDTSFDDRVLFLQNMSKPVQEFTALITIEIAKAVGRHFLTTLYPETVSIVCWSAGDEMMLHRDGHNSHTLARTHSAVVYLNDQLEGGEIYFPEIAAVINPRQALMVAYDKSLLHGVKPVKETRYTLTLWFSENSEVSIIVK